MQVKQNTDWDYVRGVWSYTLSDLPPPRMPSQPGVEPSHCLYEACLLGIRLLRNSHVWSYCESMRGLRVQIGLERNVVRVQDALCPRLRRGIEACVKC
jgi:hypothetical protein